MARGAALGAALLMATGCQRSAVSKEPVRIAAASDLAVALEAARPELEKVLGAPVALSFGATGVLRRQLEAGAPFDAFAAADIGEAQRAADSGACVAGGVRPYAVGRLLVRTRAGLAPPQAIEGLNEARFTRIALADPDQAPYGRIARESLTRAGLWEQLSPRLVRAPDVRTAAAWLERGEVDAAFLSASLVVGGEGGLFEVPATLHAPLVQGAVACTKGSHAALGGRFVEWLAGPEAEALLARHGFHAVRPAAP